MPVLGFAAGAANQADRGAFQHLPTRGLIVLAVVLTVRAVSRPDRPAASPTPQQILAERFARGEIDAEEYQARLRVLNGEPPSAQP